MNRFAKCALVVTVLAAGFSILAACGILNPIGGTGRLRVSITDKPFPFEFIESAKVTLTRVEVRQAQSEEDAENETDETPNGEEVPATQPADDDTDGPFITIFEDAEGKEFDLMLLRNGKTDLLADAEIPAGHYTQMRLVVTSGEVTLTDGRVFPLTVPSGASSGIKLHFEFDVVADQELNLLLDVDLSRAFTPIPGGHIDDVSTIRQFHFSPSIAMKLISLLEAGQIAGLATDENSAPLGSVAVAAFSGDTEVASTSTEEDGTYVLVGLPTGTYVVKFTAVGYIDTEVADVSVTAGETTSNVNVTIQATAP